MVATINVITVKPVYNGHPWEMARYQQTQKKNIERNKIKEKKRAFHKVLLLNTVLLAL